MDYMVIGEVIKAQGIKGEIKVKPLTDDARRFKKLRMVYLSQKPYKIQDCRVDTFVYLKLDGVDTRNEAEELIGKNICIDKVNSILPDADSYFIVDLIGCDILDVEGGNLGRIKDIDSFGAADVITAVAPNGKIFRFPFLKRLTESIDVSSKIMKVKKDELDGVSVYED